MPGEQPKLRHRVDDHARRLDPIDFGQNPLRRLAQLHLGRMEQRVLRLRPQAVRRRRELTNGDAVERPAMRVRGGAQLFLGLGKRDVECRLSLFDAFNQVPQGERGLPGSGDAFDQIQPRRRQAARQHVVETGDAGGLRRQLLKCVRTRGIGHRLPIMVQPVNMDVSCRRPSHPRPPAARTSFARSSRPTTRPASTAAVSRRAFRPSRTGTCTSATPSRSA